MSGLVQAARQLTREVKALGSKAEALPVGDTDGLGFQRSVRLNSEAVKALGDEVVEALEHDPRIAETVKSNKGLRVTFVSDVRADEATSFGLAEAVSVATE